MAALLTLNPNARVAAASMLPRSEADAAERTIAAWPGYSPTPIRQALPGLAGRLGVAAVAAKLEGERFTVGSFKGLGPPYALARAVAGLEPGWIAVAATSGNHGRALAWGAARLGGRCRIFMPAHTSPGRAAAIAGFGADVVHVAGDFDAALVAAEAAAAAPGHLFIADLPFRGRDDIPRDIRAGYSVVGAEILAQTRAAPPTHVFIAAGNGSLAAAVAGRLAHDLPRPLIITVEPLTSDAVRRSFTADAIVTLAAPALSVMDGLVVRTPAALAWPGLRLHVDAGLAIGDEDAVATLRAAATGAWGDPGLEIGETGIAALAGLVAAATTADVAASLGIGAASRLLAIACEGVTDRAVFTALTSGFAPLAGLADSPA